MLRPDLESIERDIVAEFHRFGGRIDHVERALAICSDRDHRIDPRTLARLIDHVGPRGLRLIEAQARRALGLARDDVDELRHAFAAFESIGALPYVARVRTELGALTGDHSMVAEGIRGLETIGDIDQLGRVAARVAASAAAGSAQAGSMPTD